MNNQIKNNLEITYKADFKNRILRISVREERVFFLKWNKNVKIEILQADNQRIFGILAGLLGFATACSQHTHVLTSSNYGELTKAPFFDVTLYSKQYIPHEIIELINHFNEISSVGKINCNFYNTTRSEKLPQNNTNISLVSGGKDSAWNLGNNKTSNGLFIKGTTINAEFLNELESAKYLCDFFNIPLSTFQIWHADTTWKSLIMRHRTIWRDLVLITLARLLGDNIYTGINKDSEFDELPNKFQKGDASLDEMFQLGFHFHNSTKALSILEKALEAKIHKIPSEYNVYKDLKLHNPELLSHTHSCQDPVLYCNPYDEKYWDKSCAKCKTIAVYDNLIENKPLEGKLLDFALSSSFGGDMEIQKQIINSNDRNYFKSQKPIEENKYDIAFSYASEDSMIVKEFAIFFRNLGLDVYFYEEMLDKSLKTIVQEHTIDVYLFSRHIIIFHSQNWKNRDKRLIEEERELISKRNEYHDDYKPVLVSLDNSEIHKYLILSNPLKYENLEKTKLIKAICNSLKLDVNDSLINEMVGNLTKFACPIKSIKQDLEQFDLETKQRNYFLWILLCQYDQQYELCSVSIKKYANPIMYSYFNSCREQLLKNGNEVPHRINQAIDLTLKIAYKEFVENLIEIPAGEVYIGFPNGWLNDYKHEIEPDIISAFRNNTPKKIDIPAFWIDKYPVTRKWAKLLGFKSPKEFPTLSHMDKKVPIDAPLTHITFFKSLDIAKLLGRQIPSEIQWEKAARGGVFLDTNNLVKNTYPLRLYPWEPVNGNLDYWDENLANLNDTDNSENYLLQNVNLSNGNSPYNVSDLCGNAWEWVQCSTEKKKAFIKGGSFFKSNYKNLNTKAGMVSSNPSDVAKDQAIDNLGFRTVCDKKPSIEEFHEILIRIKK